MIDWDKRYREGFYEAFTEPHLLLKRFFPFIEGKKIVIDIAMGGGRDTVFLSEVGFKVIGLEKSVEAIKIAKRKAKERNVNPLLVLADAEYLPFKEESADCLIVFYFLSKKRIKEFPKLLRKGGLLIYETYLKRQNLLDRWRDEEHLLEDGELLSYFEDFEILFYEELITDEDGKKKAIARFVGRKK